MSSEALTESDLIFSSASSTLKEALGELKRSDQSVKNRLQSIYSDAAFVQSVAEAYNLPLVANERCGSWYIPHEAASAPVGFVHGKKGSVYFKSTDGHCGQWSFSLRRLNLQILELIGQNGGCIIVDSTRKGKSMPDALSKTVPIWLTVFNRLLFPELSEFHGLDVPIDVVSPSEKQQIESRLEGFLAQVQTLDLDVVAFRAQLSGRPMRCLWRRPGDAAKFDANDSNHFNKIVLCTASNRASTESCTDRNYIQGAADDHETWSLGLGAAPFWAHSKQLLSSSEQDLPELVAKILAESLGDRVIDQPVLIKRTNFLWLASETSAELHAANFDIVIACTLKPNEAFAESFKRRYICMPCTTGKVGSRQLRAELSRILILPELLDATAGAPPQRILVTCQSGIDLAVGTALAILCRFGTPMGCLSTDKEPPRINKDIIKHRLSWIMISAPHVRPSRATLQSVNSFLMNS